VQKPEATIEQRVIAQLEPLGPAIDTAIKTLDF
jgi:hypothetical protein